MKTMQTIEGLRAEYDRICGHPSIAQHYKCFLRDQAGGDDPYVEIDSNGFHYVATERGTEIQRRTTRDPWELLYWFTVNVAYLVARRSIPEPGNTSVGSSRERLTRMVEVLRIARPEWGDRCFREFNGVPDRDPFWSWTAG